MSESDRPESAGMTWSLYLLCGVMVVASVVSEADDCWPMATLGVFMGLLVGAFFLAYHAKHLAEALEKWLVAREAAKTRRRRERRLRKR